VDRIDLQILRLLQQRTKIARRIGETKRRHRAVIYVPERERELLQGVNRRSRGKLPARAVTAIFREILSSSRAAQGQGGIGVLRSSGDTLRRGARWPFGACDDFAIVNSWPELMKLLTSRKLGLALLTGTDLGRILAGAERASFLKSLAIVSDFALRDPATPGEANRVYIVTPKGMHPPARADRMMILIECKTTEDAVKTWLNSMPKRLIEIETISGPTPGGSVLFRLASAKPALLAQAARALQSAGAPFAILGVYRNSEDYGG
jgi:chorismate mutase